MRKTFKFWMAPFLAAAMTTSCLAQGLAVPPPLGVPKPGPVTSRAYAPQPILPPEAADQTKSPRRRFSIALAFARGDAIAPKRTGDCDSPRLEAPRRHMAGTPDDHEAMDQSMPFLGSHWPCRPLFHIARPVLTDGPGQNTLGLAGCEGSQ